MKVNGISEIRVIALDIGGVVIPNMDDIIDSYIRGELGIDKAAFEELWRRQVPSIVTGLVTLEDFWQNIEQDLGRSLRHTHDLFLNKYDEHFAINHALLRTVRAYGKKYRLAVFSNSIAPHSVYNRKAGLYDSFDSVFLSNEIGHMKPGLSFYRCVVDNLGVSPDQIIFFDDKEENVAAALQSGINAYRFTSNEAFEEVLRGKRLEVSEL